MPRKEIKEALSLLWRGFNLLLFFFFSWNYYGETKLRSGSLTVPKRAKYNPASNSSKPKWRKAKCPSKGHSAEEPQPGQAFVSSPVAKPQECGLCCPFFQLPDCSLLFSPIWAKLLWRTMAALLEEGQLSAQLEKQRFAYTPVWCMAEGKNTIGTVGLWIFVLCNCSHPGQKQFCCV